MFRYPIVLEELIQIIGKLSGIGKKTAERLTFDLYKWSSAELNVFAQKISDLKDKVKLCEHCHNFSEDNLCFICQDFKRDEQILCIVEAPNQIKSIEESDSFNGYYHILGGKLSPLEGVGPEQLNFVSLIKRVKQNRIREIIIAISSDIEGEATSSYLTQVLQERGVCITRLALGVPVGADLSYADSSTLAMAIKQRQRL